jgi:quinolinate synthase
MSYTSNSTANPVQEFKSFASLSDKQAGARIIEARARLGQRVVLLAHHYQRESVYRYADLTGDSLKLARLAARTDAEFILFCGVHFMAEVADILSRPEQTVILPDLAAGCSMADMADLEKVERCWGELTNALGTIEARITPVTYINSAADLKAFCGERGGIVCTSTNAPAIIDWALSRREKVLFFPDQHLGRWTGYKKGIPLDQMAVWDPNLENGGLTAKEIEHARILLWKGHCSVHQMFQVEHIRQWRAQYPDGFVISHPECNLDVCRESDHVGSTEFILETVTAAPPDTRWLVGTELNLVSRLAEQLKAQGKIIKFMAPTMCMCSTMQRIDPQHLAWALENLANGNIVNPIRVPAREAEQARTALTRMLETF